ncbi:uncharacterized protein LOC106159923 [Lingula anatina]|uniref:Uncharacterized protein LOC106159923 n=1 Tax=Lingula anatina TaxID=7574 RepID=A0A2R2MIF9_LINAN|nr:uncharacterized protein LOC106159923 [Lingula anatina]|eukprot:XP_023930010.1 uncharacterized protein LOC106159923 [Lingula anatina]
MNVDLLNYWVSKFIVEVCKENGEEYPPNSIMSLVMGLQLHRVKTQKRIDFLECPDFSWIRLVLAAKTKRFTRKGMGESNSNNSIGAHWKTSILKYTEDCSKTVQGGLKHRGISNKEVVHHAKLTRSALKDATCAYSSAIWNCVQPKVVMTHFICNLHKSTPGSIWYSCQPYDINTLNTFVPEMYAKAGLSGYYTNHSLRATTAMSLFQQGLDEQLIMDQTGHRSAAGIRSYKRVGEDQRERVSE